MCIRNLKKLNDVKVNLLAFFCIFNDLIYCFICIFFVLVFIVLVLFQRMFSSNFFACDLSFDDAVKIK